MTYRQRILAALRGEPVDHIPWAPRWDLWYDAALQQGWLPDRWRNWSMFDIARDIGMGIKWIRGQVYELQLRDVEVVERQDGRNQITEWRTPHGTLQSVFRVTEDLATYGVRGLEIEYRIKGAEDYAAAHYVLDHIDVVPTYEQFDLETKEIGEDGLNMPDTGFVPFHSFLREWAGYENGYYELYDHPNQVERFLEALNGKLATIQQIALESRAPVLRFEGNYDSRLTPPPIFDRFFLPVAKDYAARAHARGKLLCTHTDGDETLLHSRLLACDFDVAEAFTPPPMTSAGIADARADWGERIAIWGGIASTVLSAWVPEADFEAHMVNLFHEAAPGRKFLLGTGDNVPTDADFQRVHRITRMVEEWGRYPIDPARLPPRPAQ